MRTLRGLPSARQGFARIAWLAGRSIDETKVKEAKSICSQSVSQLASMHRVARRLGPHWISSPRATRSYRICQRFQRLKRRGDEGLSSQHYDARGTGDSNGIRGGLLDSDDNKEVR